MATLLRIGRNLYDGKGFEYAYGGTGGDNNGNGILDIDCSHLVYNSLRAAGYHIPYLSTTDLNSGKRDKYFDIVPLADASPDKDDLVLYNGHVGIFSSFDAAKKEGTFFGSQRRGPSIAKFDEDGTYGWDLEFTVLRPKKELKIQGLALQATSLSKLGRWTESPIDRHGTRRWSPAPDTVPMQLIMRWGRHRLTE